MSEKENSKNTIGKEKEDSAPLSDAEYKALIEESMHVSNDDHDGEEAFMKGYLIQKSTWNFPLHSYENGNIMFFEEDDLVYGDKVFIAKYSEGKIKGMSEKLNIPIESSYLSDEYVLLSRESVVYMEINQSTCPDPECDSCKNGEKPPIVLSIFTNSKPVVILFDSQADAFHIMTVLTHWQKGRLDKFQESPYHTRFDD